MSPSSPRTRDCLAASVEKVHQKPMFEGTKRTTKQKSFRVFISCYDNQMTLIQKKLEENFGNKKRTWQLFRVFIFCFNIDQYLVFSAI